MLLLGCAQSEREGLHYDDFVLRRVTVGDIIRQLFTGQYSSINIFGEDVVTSFNNTIAYWGEDENGADVVAKGTQLSCPLHFVSCLCLRSMGDLCVFTRWQ